MINSSDKKLYNLHQNSGKNKKIGIVKSLWNSHITNKLHLGCLDTLTNNGVNKKDIKTLEVPGSFELIYGGKYMCKNHQLDAIILIGSIIILTLLRSCDILILLISSAFNSIISTLRIINFVHHNHPFIHRIHMDLQFKVYLFIS